jgi:hypothetical protein
MSSDRHPTVIPLVSGLVGLLAVIVVLVGAVALPAVKSGPHKIPIGVAGSEQITGQLEALFTTASNRDAFDVTTYPSEARLRTAIRHREVYGGLAVTQSAATMFVAGAGSPTMSDALSSVAGELTQSTQIQVQVTDLVPNPAEDPRGNGLGASSLPLVLAGVLPPFLGLLLYRRRSPARLGLVIAASVVSGVALAVLLGSVIGGTAGASFLPVAATLTLGVLAPSLALLGLEAVAGRIGLAVGTAVLVLAGYALMGLATAPEWLPTPWGAIGQFLPAGAEGSLLRSTAFFDGHGAGRPAVVLGVWTLAGVLLLALGAIRGRRAATSPTEPGSAPVSEADPGSIPA